MVPPGVRRSSLLNLLPFLILGILIGSASAASAVLGIDLGTEYIKAAIAKPGSPIEIVLTKDSKRKEAAALAFKPARTQNNDPDAFPERLYGGDALALSARFPTDVYMNLKSVLGLPSTSPEVKEYLARYPGLREQAITRSGDSTLGFKSSSLSKDGTFMVEELLAMELKNIKANAEVAIGKGNHVSDVVITIPPYYTAEEKRALELAANLAGLRVLGLISDGLAVGLNYATHRKFDSVTQGGKPEHHLIYDMGAGSTTATVLKFQGRTTKGSGKKNQTFQEVQVLGFGSDRTLGGDSLNDLIVKDMIEKFLASPRMQPYNLPSIEVRKHGKTMARLWKDAEKVRQVLSANSVGQTSLEGLFYEDVTFKYKLTRDEFEAMAQDHAARISRPLNDALLMADLRLADLDSVILHGGLVRTPFIQKALEEAAGGASKLKTNVNADEAAVMGAAFKAASISPAYRVRDIRSIDISGSAYTVSWTADGKNKEQKIFVPTSQLGIEKQLPVKAQDDTTVSFRLEKVDSSHEVVSIELTNLTKSVKELKEKYGCSATNISTTFNVRLALLDGTPEFAAGSVSCNAEKAKEGGVMDNVKGLFGLGKKDQAPLKAADDDASAPTPLPVDDETSSGTVVSPSAAVDSSSSSASSASPKTEPTPRVVSIPLASEVTIKGLNTPPEKELPAIKKRLSQFDASDKNAVQRAEALNVLEGFTYRAREYLEDRDFVTASTAAVRKQLEDQLAAVSEWLYGDGVDAKLEDYKAKLKSLRDIVEPVIKRKDESGKREDALATVRKELESAQSYIEMVKSSIEKAAAAALSSASSATSSVVEQASSAAAPTAGEVELDEDPYATTSSAATEETEEALPKMYEYTEEDLSTLTKAYSSVKQWLDEKLILQEKLQPHEDPAFWVADLQSKGKEVQTAVTNLVLKQIRFQPPKPKKSKSAKKDKTKSKKNKSTSSDGSAGESASESTSTSTTSSSGTTNNVKDEL